MLKRRKFQILLSKLQANCEIKNCNDSSCWIFGWEGELKKTKQSLLSTFVASVGDLSQQRPPFNLELILDVNRPCLPPWEAFAKRNKKREGEGTHLYIQILGQNARGESLNRRQKERERSFLCVYIYVYIGWRLETMFSRGTWMSHFEEIGVRT